MAGQIGLEDTPDAYVARLVEVFREVRRVLADDGTLWLNLGDSYATGAGKVGDCPGGGAQGENWKGAKTSPNRMPLPGLKPKDLIGIPWRVAFALQADGWTLRSDIIWAKPNPMPESVRDRPTKAHEYVFLLSKRARYFYDAEAVREESAPPTGGRQRAALRGDFKYRDSEFKDTANVGSGRRNGGLYASPINPAGRNARSVWTITPRPFKGAHFATFPPELAERCIKAGSSERGKCPECGAAWERVVETSYTNPGNRTTNGPRSIERRHETAGFPVRLEKHTETTGWRPTCSHGLDPVPDVVLDPFAGAGTVGLVCQRLGRSHVGIELNPAYREMALARIAADAPRMPLLAGA